MSFVPRRSLAAALLVAVAALAASPAAADHTDPSAPLTPVVPIGPEAIEAGEGTWKHISSLGGSTGTDLEFFNVGGVTYGSGGSLGQADRAIVGQRLVKLVDADGTVAPEFVADHGSGNCGDLRNVAATTGLQHDVQVTPTKGFYLPGAKPNAQLLIDTVDAVGRCHDITGGGLEFVDVSGLGTDGFEPREIHLTRHNGYSHTVTVDAMRPWIVYNSSSDFGANPTGDDANPEGIGPAWVDVMDIRTCLNLTGKTLDQKRTACRPKVFRIPFDYKWTSARKTDGEMRQPAACHDVTARPGRIYCAGLNGSLVLDVAGLTVAQGPAIPAANDPRGDIKGVPLPCTVVDATPSLDGAKTGAKVTDCSLGGPTKTGADAVQPWIDAKRPSATGWKFVGNVNHPGRVCGSNSNSAPVTCNSNTETPSDEGVALSHEVDPSPDGRYIFVTDERGGGVVPGGATCVRSIDNPAGNGGIHVFDTTKRDENGDFAYALQPDGSKAVYISKEIVASPTFCTVHVIEHIPDEQRIIAAWYSQGTKIIDYEIDENGAFTFTEIASYALQPNDIWTAEHFKIDDHPDGTRTYYFMATDVARGIDVFSWTGPTNKIEAAAAPRPAPAPAPAPRPAPRPVPKPAPLPATGADFALLGIAGLILPAALLTRRRRARAAV